MYLQTRLSVDVGDELATHVRRTWAEGVEKDIWARPGGGVGVGRIMEKTVQGTSSYLLTP